MNWLKDVYKAQILSGILFLVLFLRTLGAFTFLKKFPYKDFRLQRNFPATSK